MQVKSGGVDLDTAWDPQSFSTLGTAWAQSRFKLWAGLGPTVVLNLGPRSGPKSFETLDQLWA